MIRTLLTLLKIWRLWAWTPPEPVQHVVLLYPDGAVHLCMDAAGLDIPWTEEVIDWPDRDYLEYAQREARVLIAQARSNERPEVPAPGWWETPSEIERMGRDE